MPSLDVSIHQLENPVEVEHDCNTETPTTYPQLQGLTSVYSITNVCDLLPNVLFTRIKVIVYYKGNRHGIYWIIK